MLAKKEPLKSLEGKLVVPKTQTNVQTRVGMRKKLENSAETTASEEKRFGLPKLSAPKALVRKSDREIVILDNKNQSVEKHFHKVSFLNRTKEVGKKPSPPKRVNLVSLKSQNSIALSKSVVSIEINTPLAIDSPIDEGGEIDMTNNISMIHNLSSNEGVQKFQGKYYPKFLNGKAFQR
jgi:hypothetical protein